MTSALDAVIEVIGEAAAQMLCERLGGVPIYVPQIPTPGSLLVLAIGRGPAARLCDRMAGAYLELPSRHGRQSIRRRQDVLYDLRRGLAVSEIASRHGITTRRVMQIRRQIEQCT